LCCIYSYQGNPDNRQSWLVIIQQFLQGSRRRRSLYNLRREKIVLIWTDPQVAAALIQAAGAATAAAFAAVGTLMIGRQVARRKRLEEKLLAAQGDIIFGSIWVLGS